MKTNFLEVVMGAVVLVACACFALFVYSTTQWQPSKGYEIIAKFDRSDGLVRGSDVRLSGVKVGTVKDIRLDPDTYLAIVHITLADHVKLPKDSAAEIVSDGLLGGKFLALVPGGDDLMIPPNGEIIHTQAAVSLESLIGKFIFSASEKKDEKPEEEILPVKVKEK